MPPDPPAARPFGVDRAAPRAAGLLAAPEHVTIVSGLPRSGTSLLMQLLAAAGLELAHDGVRGPDADNPRGYFELEAVRRLREDAAFLEDCRGRVVKIVAPLVLEVGSSLARRVIFVERDLGEVLASQRAMLARRDEPWRAAQEEDLRRAFESVVARCRERLTGHSERPALFVDHAALIHSPEVAIDRIVEFLAETGALAAEGRGLRSASEEKALSDARLAMLCVVEPVLHRQRVR